MVSAIEKNKSAGFLIVLIVIFGFAVAVIPLTTIKFSVMGKGSFFFESATPFSYWIGLLTILGALIYYLPRLKGSRSIGLFIFSSIMLMVLIRCVFPIIFKNIVVYEPDASNYLTVVNTWLRSSFDLGVSGNYQHDYPLSFIIAYSFGKFGAPTELFFRFAPFAIYALDIILVYLIITQLTSKPKVGAVGVFLFSISPLNYWLAVHFCPDLLGSLFFLFSLYLVIRVAQSKNLKPINVLPLLVSIFLLILSHHLSTLYFIVTMAGLAFTAWYFKSPFKGKARYFTLIGVYTAALWLTYGAFMYPQFFNIYNYFWRTGSAVTLAFQASLFENFCFVVYPVFIFALALLYINEAIGLKNVINRLKSPTTLIDRSKIVAELPLVMQYSFGYVFIIPLFFTALAIPSIFAPRVLEVLLIGVYPLAAISLTKLTSEPISRRRMILLFVIISIIVLLGTHRYYSQIQGRIVR